MIPFRIKNSFSQMDSLTSASFPPPAKIPIPIQLAQPFVISNFTHYFTGEQLKKYPFVYSENFSTSKKLETYCEVCPRGESEQWDKFISAYLTFESNEIFVKESIEVELSISVIDLDGRRCNTKETKVILDKVGRWGWPDFIERDYLLDPANNLVANDQLKLLFEVKFDGETFNVDITKTVIDQIELPPIKFDARTETICLTHRWTIENFTQFPSSQDETRFDEFIDSDIFSIPTECNIDQFYLKVYPKSPNNYLGIFLFFLSHWRKEIFVHMRVSLLNENGKPNNTMGCAVKIANGTNWGWDFIDNDLLLNFANGVLNDDKLSILCEVKIIDENQLKEGEIHENVLNEIAKLSVENDQSEQTGNNRIFFSENVTNAAKENSLVRFAHKWTIENFKEIFQNDDPKFIDSRCFSPYPENEESEEEQEIGRFYLRLYPKGYNQQTQNHVSVFLYSELETIIRYRIYILVNGKAFIQRYDVQHKMIRTKIMPKIGVGFPRFISHEKLLNSVNDFLLPDNKLTIFCEIETMEPNLLVSPNPDLSPKPQSTEFEHSWIIDNFENYFANKLNENNKYFFLQSPNFTSPTNVEHEFHIRLYPNGFDEITAGKLCIFLWPMCRGPPVKIYERVKVYDDNRVNRFIKESRDKFQGMIGNIGKYISSKEIIEKTCTNRQLTGLTGNNLTVCMQIKITEYIDKELRTDSPPDPIPTSKTFTRIAKFLHKWTVDNFQPYFEPILERYPTIQNNEIFIYFNKKIELGISMYPKGMDEASEGRLVLSSMVNTHFVNPARWIREEVDAFELKVYVVDDETGNRLTSKDGSEEFIYRDKHWGLFNPEFIKTKNYHSISIFYELYIIEMSPESPGKLEISDNFVIDNFCEQWKVKRQRDIATSYTHALTQLVQHHVEYQWDLENFFTQILSETECLQEEPFFLDSPKFSPPNNRKIKFYIRIYPKGENTETSNIACVLLCSDAMETDVMLQFKMSLMDTDGQKFRVKDDTKRMLKGSVLEWSDFVVRDYLLEQNELGKLDDTLRIHFEIDAFIIPESKRIPKIVIADKWTSFLDHEHPTNLVIHFGEENSLYAHYNILAMSSLFFNNIWTIKHKNMAHMENRIELTNIEDVHVFEELLKLVYSGRIDQYGDKSLDTDENNEFNTGNPCERFLLSKLSLTVSSAAVLYILSHICKEAELKLKFAKFIIEHFKEVMQTKAWKIMVECWPELMEDILKVSVEQK